MIRETTLCLVAAALPAGSSVYAQCATGEVQSEQKISQLAGGFTGNLDAGDRFGWAAAPVGDLDNDGIQDLAIGADGDDDGFSNAGAVWILFMDVDGTVATRQKISDTVGGFTGTLGADDRFGSSLAAIGDLDGDGVEDLAVGADGDDDGAFNAGSVWILFLNTNGTVKSHQKISLLSGGFVGSLGGDDAFGDSVASIGDLDGDSVGDIVVGAEFDDDGNTNAGAVWVLFLNTNGTVSSQQKISSLDGGFTGTLIANGQFGDAVAGLGDLDGDGVTEIAVGADASGAGTGSVWILFMNDDGTVASHQKIDGTNGGFTGALDFDDLFGRALAALGDFDGNGVEDLAVGAIRDSDGGPDRGAVWILYLNSDGTVSSHQKISSLEGGLTGPLDDDDEFGESIALLGDLDVDGVLDLAVGASNDDDGDSNAGAVYILFLEADSTAPDITCPADVMVECTNPAGEVVTFSASATDLCDPSPSVVCVPPSGSTFQVGTTTVTCTATDASGNTSMCTFDVIVTDTVAPDVTCPADPTVECTSPAGAVVNFSPSATDLCDPNPSIVSVPASGSTFALGTTTVTVTATDASGNSAMCMFDVTVEDTTAPSMNCPAEVTEECTSPMGAIVNFSVSATDTCDPTPSVVCFPPSGSLFAPGTTTVTCTATDASGNSAICMFDVVVEDTTAPDVTCPTQVTAECTSPAGAFVSFSVSATDDCDTNPSVVCVPPSGSLFPPGTTMVTCTATDASGNSAQCSFDVIVEDTTAPDITCPADPTVECTSPAGATVTFSLSATDACDPNPSIVCVPPSGSTFPLGTTMVTCTATDASGNSSQCTFDVIVEDTTAPDVTCPGETTAECTSPAGALVSFSVSATDACDTNPSVVCIPPSGSLFPPGTTMVTCTATDASGNFSQCAFEVIVEDTTAPDITCPADPTVECTSPLGAIVTFAVSATDTCDPIPSIVCVPPSGSTFPLGTTMVTCTATDASGNSSQCTFDVIVEDTTPPDVTCPADTTAECTSPAGATVVFSVSATDLCDTNPSVVCVPPSGSTFPPGTTTVNCTATDSSGNSAMCSFDVTVEDTTDPDITCPADLTEECTSPAGAVVTFSPSVTDLCDPNPSVVCVPESGSTFAFGTTIVTCTATDASGNSAQCAFNVTVEDTTPPDLACPTGVLVFDTQDPSGTIVDFVVEATDLCDPSPLVVCAPASGTFLAPGYTQVQCTAADSSGNQSTCSFGIVVRFDDPATCPPVVEKTPNDFRVSQVGVDGDAGRDAEGAGVAYNSQDDLYLVVWSDDRVSADELEIHGRLVDRATGTPFGSDFRISSAGTDGDATLDAVSPAAAYNSAANEFLVVWLADGGTPVPLDGEFEIFGQRLDGATGAELGADDFRISDVGPDGDTTSNPLAPSVAYNSTANEYLVVWSADDAPTTADDELEVFGQLLDGTGAEIGVNDFRLSDMGSVDGDPAFDSAGVGVAYNVIRNEYLVVWTGDDDSGLLADDELEIFGQLLDAAGNEIGANDFRVSDMGPDGDPSFDALEATAAHDPDNDNYFVAWNGNDDTLGAGEVEIFGQLLDGTGATVGSNDFRVSSMGPDGDAAYAPNAPSAVNNSERGEFFVVWNADDDTAPQVDGEHEVFGQRVDAATGAEVGPDDVRLSDMGPDGNPFFDAGADAGQRPALAFSPGGDEYLVAWEGDDNSGALVDDEFEIFGQRVLGGAPVMTADADVIALSTGGDQNWSLDGGPALAGDFYLVMGSGTGTAPGIPIDNGCLPLNPDGYLSFTISTAGTPPLVNTFGILGPAGQGSATLSVPSLVDPGAIGLTLHHAFGVITAGGELFASNAVPVTFVP